MRVDIILDDLPENASRTQWNAALKDFGARHGFFEKIGNDHTALFVREGKTLIVTFENLDHVYERGEGRLPWGFEFVRARGWSILGLMAHDWTWYRDEDVHDFFDRLRAEGFFNEFDRVIFYGASMGAYAACSFSSASPNSTVIAISPQATLNRTIASWETRYRKVWRRDFDSRYGYAPDMLQGAGKVYIFYDPLAPLDAMHAALFRGANITKFECRHFGHRIASAMQGMGILKPVVEGCVDDELSSSQFYQLLRKRRKYPRYLKGLLLRLDELDRPWLTIVLCEYVLSKRRGPAFRERLISARRKLE